MTFPFPLVVVDVENTKKPGDPEWAKSLEIGAVLLDKDGKQASTFHARPGTLSVMGFIQWLRANGNPPLTSYNVSFDKERLAGVGVGGPEWAPDILPVVIQIMGDEGALEPLDNGEQGRTKWPTLEEAAEFFGVKHDGAHHALVDAKMAAGVVRKIEGKG